MSCPHFIGPQRTLANLRNALKAYATVGKFGLLGLLHGGRFAWSASWRQVCLVCFMEAGLLGLLHGGRSAWSVSWRQVCLVCFMETGLLGLLHGDRRRDLFITPTNTHTASGLYMPILDKVINLISTHVTSLAEWLSI